MHSVECLECTVLGARLLVPTQDLERVVGFALSAPPPLAEPWVAGLGLVDGIPVLSLALPGKPKGPLADGKALLLRRPGSAQRYALQVDDVRAIWTVNEDAFKPGGLPGWPCPPGWLTQAQDGADLVLRLNTDAVSADLFGQAGAPQSLVASA